MFIENKLKSLSTQQLETIIAKAISDSIGESFEAIISSIQYGEALWPQTASFHVKISQPIKLEEGT